MYLPLVRMFSFDCAIRLSEMQWRLSYFNVLTECVLWYFSIQGLQSGCLFIRFYLSFDILLLCFCPLLVTTLISLPFSGLQSVVPGRDCVLKLSSDRHGGTRSFFWSIAFVMCQCILQLQSLLGFSSLRLCVLFSIDYWC